MIISFVLSSVMIKLSMSGNAQRSSAHGGFNTLWSHAVIWQPRRSEFLLKHHILHCCGFLFLPEMVTVMLCHLWCRDHPCSRGERLEDGLLLLL